MRRSEFLRDNVHRQKSPSGRPFNEIVSVLEGHIQYIRVNALYLKDFNGRMAIVYSRSWIFELKICLQLNKAKCQRVHALHCGNVEY